MYEVTCPHCSKTSVFCTECEDTHLDACNSCGEEVCPNDDYNYECVKCLETFCSFCMSEENDTVCEDCYGKE